MTDAWFFYRQVGSLESVARPEFGGARHVVCPVLLAVVSASR
jgi:hypothetical protein